MGGVKSYISVDGKKKEPYPGHNNEVQFITSAGLE